MASSSEDELREPEEIERALAQARNTPGAGLVKDGDLADVLADVDSDVPARFVEATLEWVLGREGDGDE